jgi:hypothetical protein
VEVSIGALYKEMQRVAAATPDYVEFTVAEFTKIMRNFTASSDVKILSARHSEVDLNQIVITGEYDPFDDESGLPAITITVNYSPQQKTVKFNDVDWPQVCIDLIECTGHEVIHRQQYRNRNFEIPELIFASKGKEGKAKEIQEYLGNVDEIEAHGYSIAAEVFLKYQPKRLNVTNVKDNLIFKAYVAAFGRNHHIVKKLIKYSLTYFEFLHEGKV